MYREGQNTMRTAGHAGELVNGRGDTSAEIGAIRADLEPKLDGVLSWIRGAEAKLAAITAGTDAQDSGTPGSPAA